MTKRNSHENKNTSSQQGDELLLACYPHYS